MRRADREMSTEFALGVFAAAEYATLSSVSADGEPYGVPVSPVMMNGAVYFHCATEGHKLDNIAANPQACISAVSRTKLVPSMFTTEYDSAIVFGTCEIVADDEEKREALREICRKFAPPAMAERVERMIESSLGETAVCRVTIDRITGKSNGGKG